MRTIAPRSFIAAPLVARGRTLGVLTFVFSAGSTRRYLADDVPLAEELARRCALAVDNARLYGLAQRIPRQFLPHVFKPFRQRRVVSCGRMADWGPARRSRLELLELHGGTIAAESDGEGQGATFTIRLPVKPVRSPRNDRREGVADSRLAERTVSSLSSVRVLIVEDEADSRELLTMVFAASGADVTAVATAGDAITTIRHHGSDALVADIGLPDQDGYALIREVRGLEEHGGTRMPATRRDRPRQVEGSVARHRSRVRRPRGQTDRARSGGSRAGGGHAASGSGRRPQLTFSCCPRRAVHRTSPEPNPRPCHRESVPGPPRRCDWPAG